MLRSLDNCQICSMKWPYVSSRILFCQWMDLKQKIQNNLRWRTDNSVKHHVWFDHLHLKHHVWFDRLHLKHHIWFGLLHLNITPRIQRHWQAPWSVTPHVLALIASKPLQLKRAQPNNSHVWVTPGPVQSLQIIQLSRVNWWVYSIGWVESTGCITSTSVDLRGTGNTPQSSAFRHNSNSQWLLMHVCNYDRSILWCSNVHWRNDGNCGNCDNCMINYMSGVTKDTYGNVHLYAYGKRELVPSEDNIFWPSSAAKSIQLCKIIRCCNNHWRYFATHTRVWNTYGSTQGDIISRVSYSSTLQYMYYLTLCSNHTWDTGALDTPHMMVNKLSRGWVWDTYNRMVNTLSNWKHRHIVSHKLSHELTKDITTWWWIDYHMISVETFHMMVTKLSLIEQAILTWS